MHEHLECDHTLQYCKTCKVAYCTKCGKQWYENSYWIWYNNPGWNSYRITYDNSGEPIPNGEYIVSCNHGS